MPKKGFWDAQSFCLAGIAAHLFPSIVPSQLPSPPNNEAPGFRGMKSSYPFPLLLLSPRSINTVGPSLSE